MTTFKERKTERTQTYNSRHGRKTGDLVEIAEVKWFYATQSDSAQAREEQRKRDEETANLIGEVNKYYVDEG
jgi:hypothetical protein